MSVRLGPLALATHAVAGFTFLYVLRSLATLRGWRRVPTLIEDRALPSLSIVVPARDEERNIERCVRSLLAQRGLDVELIVVDDDSTDATPMLLERLQREDPALQVVHGEPLPSGWVGKPWACAQGAARARGDWLLFTDADSDHAPDASRSTLAYILEQRAHALSIMTGQELGTLAERAVLPAILALVVFASGTLDELNDPARRDRALANGQYLLVSRVAYDALGGHAALRDAVVEDVEFARRLKADGRFRLLVADGTPLVRVRMYRSFREIWEGFTKNAYLGARGNLGALAGGVGFCATLSIVPPLLAAAALRRGAYATAAEAAAATFAVGAVGWYGSPFVSLPRRDGLFAPFGIAVFGAILINSTRRALTGRGFAWRGRAYGVQRGDGRGSANRPSA